ncbi:MAG: hypothetical protein ACLTZY_04335 [Alistipes indistinctus]
MPSGIRDAAPGGTQRFEVTDALVIAVSEERGTISVARQGHIRQNLTPIQLHAHLSKNIVVILNFQHLKQQTLPPVNVVVPLYRTALNPDEWLSLERCFAVLGGYPITFVIPEGASV